MNSEPILSALGYDPALLRGLSAAHRTSLRGAAVAWLVACGLLGIGAAYGAWIVQPVFWMPLVVGIGMTLLSMNLLRVVTAGGGVKLQRSRQRSKRACEVYRPSLAPTCVLGALAAILSQPAQLPLWNDLESEVEVYREKMIVQHNEASTSLGTKSDLYRAELESAGFPILRLKLMWQRPRLATRRTAIFCFLVLVPAFWSRFIAIASIRAYQWQRCKRAHDCIEMIARTEARTVAAALSQWPSYGSQTGGAA